GSTMDVAKALSVMMCNEGSASQYQGWDLVPNPGIYKIGIPTVAGSGAEASRTAVLMGKERKFGINSDHSMFDAIILDSSLIKNVPIAQRFYSGMDCYIHCVESLQGTMINELAKGNASKALELCEKVFLSDGDDDMLLTASYMGGVSIVNSEVGVCHALSYGLSLELGYRHGFANCVAFNVLDEYYGPWVDRFREMLKIHKIELPKNVCRSLDEAAMQRMVNMTLKMERPLTNALGENWKDKMTPNKIVSLYERM
ncbi:iron-containing alcohol dehydrogenase, partial [Leptospira interrogans]